MTTVLTQISLQSKHNNVILSIALVIGLEHPLNYSSIVKSKKCYSFLVIVGFSQRRAGRYVAMMPIVTSHENYGVIQSLAVAVSAFCKSLVSHPTLLPVSFTGRSSQGTLVVIKTPRLSERGTPKESPAGKPNFEWKG